MKWNNEAYIEYFGIGREEIIKLISCELYGEGFISKASQINTGLSKAGPDEIQAQGDNRTVVSKIKTNSQFHAQRTAHRVEIDSSKD